jgi:hypothetical protein
MAISAGMPMRLVIFVTRYGKTQKIPIFHMALKTASTALSNIKTMTVSYMAKNETKDFNKNTKTFGVSRLKPNRSKLRW